MSGLQECVTCVYDAETGVFYDMVGDDGLTQYGKENAVVYADRIGAKLWAFDEAYEHMNERVRTGPSEITEEQFRDALGELPPEDWCGGGDTESFKCMERLTGQMTTIYCRLGERYFWLTDTFRKPHSEIVVQCRAFITGESCLEKSPE